MLDCHSGHIVPEENKSDAPSSVEYVKTPLDFNTESRLKDLAESQTTTANSQRYAPWCPSPFSCEIPRENVVIEKIIGKGAFGQVAKGTVTGLRGRFQATLVAVKMLKGMMYFLVTFINIYLHNSSSNRRRASPAKNV